MYIHRYAYACIYIYMYIYVRQAEAPIHVAQRGELPNQSSTTRNNNKRAREAEESEFKTSKQAKHLPKCTVKALSKCKSVP